MNPRELTPEELAMIALGEGRNAFANLRESHAELLTVAKSALRALRSYNPGPLADKSDPVRSALIAAIAKAEGRAE